MQIIDYIYGLKIHRFKATASKSDKVLQWLFNMETFLLIEGKKILNIRILKNWPIVIPLTWIPSLIIGMLIKH